MLTFELQTLIFVLLLLLLAALAAGFWLARRRSARMPGGGSLLGVLDDAPFGVAAMLDWSDNVWMGVTVENYDIDSVALILLGLDRQIQTRNGDLAIPSEQIFDLLSLLIISAGYCGAFAPALVPPLPPGDAQ